MGRTKWTTRTTRKTSSTTTTTTSTTMPSHLRHTMCSSLPSRMLSTKETLDTAIRQKVTICIYRSFGLSGKRSTTIGNEFVKEFNESMVKTFYTDMILYFFIQNIFFWTPA